MVSVTRKTARFTFLAVITLLIYYSLSYRHNFSIFKYLVSDWTGQSVAPNIAYGSSTIANYEFSNDECGEWIKRGLHSSNIDDFLSYAVLQPKNVKIKNVVVYLGENDLAGKVVIIDVIRKYNKLLEHLLLLYPNSVIHVLGLKMSPARVEFWISFNLLNAHLRIISERESKVRYHSIDKLNASSEEVFLFDGVHLNQSGYKMLFTGVYSECKN